MQASVIRASVALFALLLPMACGGNDAGATSPATPPASSVTVRDDSCIAGLEPLPDELGALIGSRRAYVPRIELDPQLAARAGSSDAIRDALLASQPLIASAMYASRRLNGTLPPHVELTEEQVAQGLHLAEPRTVLLRYVRLLRADAVRCWELQDAEECAARLIAALDIAAYLLSHDDQESRFRGGQSFVPLLFDLDALRADGFDSAVPPATRATLGMHLRRIDPTRCLVWDDSAKAGLVRTALLGAFPD